MSSIATNSASIASAIAIATPLSSPPQPYPCLRSHALIPSSPIHSATADLPPFVDTVFLTCFSLSYYISTTFRSKTSGLSPLPQTPFIATFQIENHQSLGHLLQLVDSSERQSSGSSAISVGFVVAATWYTHLVGFGSSVRGEGVAGGGLRKVCENRYRDGCSEGRDGRDGRDQVAA